MRVRSRNVSLSPDRTFRLCDVTDEGLVILEFARFADQPMNRGSYEKAQAELRRLLGRNGALLAVAPVAWFKSWGEAESPE